MNSNIILASIGLSIGYLYLIGKKSDTTDDWKTREKGFDYQGVPETHDGLHKFDDSMRLDPPARHPDAMYLPDSDVTNL